MHRERWQQAFWTSGNHYVAYPDGEESKLMPYRNARDYASLFGGVVKYNWPVWLKGVVRK